ncbi:MAG: nucleotidyl transferase AbiEii/AbiGii toxin family protein [Marinospirillum sp.]|uniref:nucleotidyl transferase AbiEii/AbiGii toxin family protein n=1 Tax=Marinospirillum sp. TaxID=2183934 RepID=UPI0019F5E7BD|nr:nucleotidyl transferase AbiEii/AbiGii toxin family protein [Marinospirillum sp.]MBE0506696.1 nucleotidyl transferase AbiEii/AbiGii toxin family protein [Marinospirillum sp.]
MNERNELQKMVDQIVADYPEKAVFRPVLEKEILHYDILFALSRENLLQNLIFQGGTSLRLCYGGVRYSEDLNFAGGKAFVSTDVSNIKEAIEDHIGSRYRLDVAVKYPKDMRTEPDYDNVRVDKWQVAIETSPGRRDMPKQKIKLEIANIPAYTSEARFLHLNYPNLPVTYADLVLQVESATEIMADKVVSLCASTKHIRYRDIWDLVWLSKKGFAPNYELIAKKTLDYQIDGFDEMVKMRVQSLPSLIESFMVEMNRFVPSKDMQPWSNEAYKRAALTRISELLMEASKTPLLQTDEIKGNSLPPEP